MSQPIGEELVRALRCPDTGQGLRPASDEELARIQEGIGKAEIRTPMGVVVTESLEGGLMTIDGKRLYPVREGFPVVLLAESLVLDGAD